MRSIICYIISKIKGSKFEIDKNIPIGYLISISTRKFLELVVGLVVFKRRQLVYVHPSSKIKCRKKIRFGKNLRLDRNCFIDALSVNGLSFGDNCSVGKNTTIECTGSISHIGLGLNIGNNVGLGTHGFFGCAGGIEIGSDTIFGNYVSIHSENHNFQNMEIPIRLQGVNRKGIKIGENCWIGAKVTILDGAKIGNGCVVAAGAVVKDVFPDNCVIGGVPAKVIKYREVKL